jgi:hypothetical protein
LYSHFCIFFSLGGFIARLEPSGSGSFAMFGAIRRASSFVSSLALAVLHDSFSVRDVSDYP